MMKYHEIALKNPYWNCGIFDTDLHKIHQRTLSGAYTLKYLRKQEFVKNEKMYFPKSELEKPLVLRKLDLIPIRV
jgi:hypothetical protein